MQSHHRAGKGKSRIPLLWLAAKEVPRACIGDEPRLAHDARLLAGLGKLKIKTWPFDGPAYLKEGDEILLIENWAYLGSATSEDEIWQIMDGRQTRFDRDTYKILSTAAGRLQPLVLQDIS